MPINRKRVLLPAALLLAVVLAGAPVLTGRDAEEGPTSSPGNRAPAPTSAGGPSAPVTETTLLVEVMAAPELAGFGELIFPNRDRITDDMTVADVGDLLPYHSNIEPAEVAGTLNDLLARVRDSQVTFHRVYSEEEIANDPAKAEVGLFFYAGEPGAPFAVVSPGGGFSYVGSIHEGFPYANAITGHGYHAFVLNYRVGDGGQPATEDLAAAINYIFDNQDTLGVSTEGYSLWGSSAGARMAANLSSYGTAAFGATDRPRPATVVMAYTGHSDYTTNDPATFAVVGSDDGIANPTTMQSRIDRLQQVGIETEFQLHDGIGHGFGLGTDTIAEGWLDDAVRFWQRQIDDR